MRILICDDEKEIREQLSSAIQDKFKDFRIYDAESSDGISRIINGGTPHFDIVFMDITLKEESGIEVANKFSELFAESRIIFISGFPEKVSSIFFKVTPFGFINKPLDKELIYRYIEKAIKEKENGQKYLSFIESGKEIRIPFSNIMYIESVGRKLFVRTQNGEFTISGKIDNIDDMPASFVRCHKSFIVNLNYVISYSKHCFVMKDKKEINVSRSRQSETESKYYIFRGGIA